MKKLPNVATYAWQAIKDMGDPFFFTSLAFAVPRQQSCAFVHPLPDQKWWVLSFILLPEQCGNTEFG